MSKNEKNYVSFSMSFQNENNKASMEHLLIRKSNQYKEELELYDYSKLDEVFD